MIQTEKFSQFTIVHQIKRRIRIVVPCLYRDKERSTILKILLLKREEIEQVKIISRINSVTILFDPDKLPIQNLLNLLENVLANFSLKPLESIKIKMEKGDRQDKPKQKIVFGIGGMSCASCALFLEMVLSREQNNSHVSINYISEIGVVIGYLSKAEIFKIIEHNGYQAYSIDTLAERKLLLENEKKHVVIARKRLAILSLMSVPVMLVDLFSRNSKSLRLMQAIISFPIIFLGGQEFFKKSWIQARQKSMNMDTLIAIGAGSAFAVSIPSIFNNNRHAYFNAATAIIEFVMIGRYLEELAKNKMIQEVGDLVKMHPHYATLLQDDEEIQITTDKINIDEVLLIRPGERFPVDGIVLSGLSSVDESMITGNNMPSIKEKGHKLFDGSINGSGVLQMKTTAVGKDTVLAGLVHMIDQTQNSKLQVQRTADKISSHLVSAIALLSSITFLGWIARGEGIAHAFGYAVSVLLISCPCALGLATPAATIVSSRQAARRGIYIRNGNAPEIMAKIDTIIFDKTGTLTESNAKVSNFINISDLKDDYLLELAASVEFNSEHLLAKAIVEYAKSKGLSIKQSSKFYSVPDQGVHSQVDKHEVVLGNIHWLDAQEIDSTELQEAAKKMSLQGKTLIYLAVDNKAIALFALSIQLRKGTRQVIDSLHKQGIETHMLTGDTEESARPIAELSGIESIKVQASPAEKIQFVKDLQSQGKLVAMIGDGINDAPALAAANVSLVVGNAIGIANEAADFVLVDGNIAKVTEMLDISQQTLSVIKQNLFWAFSYNIIAIPVAMSGKLNPMIASAAMAMSSISVIANSLRIRKK